MEINLVNELMTRLNEKAPLIQVVLGPRQVGKTTAVKQALKKLKSPSVYCNADDLIGPSRQFILEYWQKAKLSGSGTMLVIDEVQKIDNWSEVIKKLWDQEDKKSRLKCVLLGSSSLHLQKGLTESLAGRYELLPVYHWNFHDSKKAFKLTLDQYLNYGGYPGSYEFISQPGRWSLYIKQSVIEAVIGRDILQFRNVSKPSLFKHAFEIFASYPAREISYTKLLNTLQTGGNTDLVKYYMSLYEGAFLFKTLQKYSSKPLVMRGSSPKILCLCPALASVFLETPIKKGSDAWGRMFEMVVGCELNRLEGDLFYWRDGVHEVDYVLKFGGHLYAIEVKSTDIKSHRGMDVFLKKFPNACPIIVTPDNFEKFSQDAAAFLKALT